MVYQVASSSVWVFLVGKHLFFFRVVVGNEETLGWVFDTYNWPFRLENGESDLKLRNI